MAHVDTHATFLDKISILCVDKNHSWDVTLILTVESTSGQQIFSEYHILAGVENVATGVRTKCSNDKMVNQSAGRPLTQCKKPYVL